MTAAALLRRAWRGLPLPERWRGAAGRAAIGAVGAGLFGPRSARLAPTPLSEVSPGPLVVSGFMHRAFGVAVAGRATVRGLAAEGLPVETHDIEPILASRIDRAAEPPGAPGGVWIAHCNAPELLRLLAAFPPEALAGRYRIGVWAWELPRLPRRWARAARGLNEIWAPSRFVADAVIEAVGQGAGAPVVRVAPHVLPSMAAVRPDRARFGVPEAAVVVLVMFDMRSSRARKNPDAAVSAFLTAFPEARDDRVLVCKVLGGEASPRDMTALRERFAGRADLVLIEESLDDAGTLALIAGADIVLSTHRAEGYGLVMAEAMALGRCVVATGWSGNTDFMTADNSVLLPFSLVPVADPQRIYPPGQVWAEVDAAAAADALRSLAEDPARRAALGERARADIA
ncbi:MAG: glycosyltransferase, partial [Caulobacter sp.]